MFSLHFHFFPTSWSSRTVYRSLPGSPCPQACGNLLAARGWKDELLYASVLLSQGFSSSGRPHACPRMGVAHGTGYLLREPAVHGTYQ